MPFLKDQFAPHLVVDARARIGLTEVTRTPRRPVRLIDIIAAAARTGQESVRYGFEASLGSSTWDEFLDSLPDTGSESMPATLSRQDFSPESLKALDGFWSVLRGSGGVLQAVSLDLLLHFCLINLSDSEASELAGLDIAEAAGRFRSTVTNEMSPEFSGSDDETEESDGPALLPPELVPSADLTRQAGQADSNASHPFDDEPLYDRIFDSLARALHRREHPFAILVGERGVGKSTILAEAARRAISGGLPFLSDCRFIIADGKHVPPDESRPRLMALLSRTVSESGLVLCLDGLAALLRSDRGLTNVPVLMEAAARARCRIIGLMTPREYEEFVGDNPEFAELFVRIDVPEPEPAVALRLLNHYAAGLQERYRTIIDPEAVRQAVTLTADYVLNDQLPAKALKVLVRACEELNYERSQLGRTRERIVAGDVVAVIASLTGVPAETLRGIAECSDYERTLSEIIAGQDHAVREVAAELGLIKAGMTDPAKPASVMLFLGQTGTGKTETAKALARIYSSSKRLKTYALGNCVEPHSVATIIGVPPGYVGSDRGGRLVNELAADPYCVVLLDEADKAHPDVLQPFLNLFDEGWIVDQRGNKAFGDKAIFIMTTNVGQRMIAELAKEGKTPDEIAVRMKEALSQIRHSKSDRPVFTPEFLARIKRIIVFKSLDETAMRSIARKLISELNASWLERRGKQLDIPEALADYIGSAAHRLDERSGGREGGRVVRKLLAEWLESPLQREMTARAGEYKLARTIGVQFRHPETSPAGGDPYAPAEVSFSFMANSG